MKPLKPFSTISEYQKGLRDFENSVRIFLRHKARLAPEVLKDFQEGKITHTFSLKMFNDLLQQHIYPSLVFLTRLFITFYGDSDFGKDALATAEIEAIEESMKLLNLSSKGFPWPHTHQSPDTYHLAKIDGNLYELNNAKIYITPGLAKSATAAIDAWAGTLYRVFRALEEYFGEAFGVLKEATEAEEEEQKGNDLVIFRTSQRLHDILHSAYHPVEFPGIVHGILGHGLSGITRFTDVKDPVPAFEVELENAQAVAYVKEGGLILALKWGNQSKKMILSDRTYASVPVRYIRTLLNLALTDEALRGVIFTFLAALQTGQIVRTAERNLKSVSK